MRTFSIALLKSIAFPALLTIFGTQAVLAQSITPTFDGTGTIVNQNSNTFNIGGGTQSGANLYQSFQQFGLNQGQTANFLSNPSIQNILGRVTGGNASVINGLIQVSGGNSNLFLMNPAGIIFGPNASLNVPAAFTATTANAIGIGNGWFNAIGDNNYAALTGTPNSFAFLNQPGAILNAGNLSVGQGQRITLLGGTVVNTGTIAAPGGNITIAAIPGEKLVRVSQSGSLLSLELPIADRTAINPATATPLSLPELLTGSSRTEATGVTVENGVVKLTANKTPISTSAGSTTVSGTLTTAATVPSTIHILGDTVQLISANLDASGTNGGGTILVGGDYQGKGTVPNAHTTAVSSDSVLKADALTKGNGGKVIIWADETTQFHGSISARGGAVGGNGGLVETSGKVGLNAAGGRVDAGAPLGLAGTWLLDPSNITISTGATTDSTLPAFDPTGATGTVNTGDIQTALAGGTNVSISTAGGSGGNGDIFLNAPIDANATNNATLTLTGRYLTPSGGSTISIGNGNLTLNINQVNNTPTPVVGTLQNALAAVGQIGGATTINLGAGTYNEGSTTVISKNLALNGAGAASTTVTGNNAYGVFQVNGGVTATLNGLTIANGNAADKGGGISNTGTLTVKNSIISSNSAVDGGGISNTGTLTISGTTISGNSAHSSGISFGIEGGGGILNFGTLIVNNSAISGNSTQYGAGGGIANGSTLTGIGTLTVNNSTISGNSAFNGGGIANYGNAYNIPLVTINKSTISGNSATGGGGGILNGGTLTVNNSTISGNSAFSGGGISNTNLTPGKATLLLNNSTISGNSAVDGGGIYNGSNSQLEATTTVKNSTISGNSAQKIGGGIFTDIFAPSSIPFKVLTLNNSIVAGNAAPGGREIFQFRSYTISEGHNLFGFSGDAGLSAGITLAPTDIIPTVPLNQILTPLGNYGGATQTMALLPGSPAINAGNSNLMTADQRGVAPVGIRDIGAYESKGFALTFSGGTAQNTPVNTDFATPITVTLTETAFNRPIPGVPLNFAAPTDGASATLTNAITNATGAATVLGTANGNAGSYTVFVLANGVTLASFTLTNEAVLQTSAEPQMPGDLKFPSYVESDLQGKPVSRSSVTLPPEETSILCKEGATNGGDQGLPACR
jgi:filamentous hemagglutinin family protein